jgi:tyrosinase
MSQGNELHRGPDDSGRRIFIKGLGWVGLGLVSTTLLGGCETILEKIRNRPIRRRLRTGSAVVDNDIAIYRDAVAAMRALPNGDPRSWFAQSAIHGTAGVGFNFCHHGTPHFFSWHRAYLLYFERICQALTGEPKFGLPYWNWNQNPDVHPAFLDPASSLFEGSRVNTSVAGVSNFTDTTLNPIFDDANFFTFGSQIEGTPHNRGHTRIGGIMGGFGSAGDPLFWMHHCMVDYCWAKWNIELENDNTNDPGWNGTSWDHFFDGNGDPASITAGATTLLPLLSYRYECSTIGRFGCSLDLTALSAAEFRKLEARIKKGADVRFDIRLRVPISEARRLIIGRPMELKSQVSADDFAAIVDADAARERVFLSMDYADLPRQNDFFVRAFINLPGADDRTSIDSDHYAGAFSFFGTRMAAGHGQHSHAPSFLINVTETLKKLRRSGRLRNEDPISVQLVALPEGQEFRARGVELNLQGLAFVVSPVTIRQRD